MNLFTKKRFHEAHSQIPAFAFAQYEGEDFYETYWWIENPLVYILNGDFAAKEFNPDSIVDEEIDESAIILINGDLSAELICDYTYLNRRHEIIIEGNVFAKNLIIDSDYFYIGGDAKIDELLIVNPRREMNVEGKTYAKLGILRLDYALHSKNGAEFEFLCGGDESATAKWDEKYPREFLTQYLDDELLVDYQTLGGMPNNWSSQLDILKIYEAVKTRSILKTPEIDNFFLPLNQQIFDYSKISSRIDWQNQKDNFQNLVKMLQVEGFRSVHFNLGEMRVSYLKECGRNNKPHFLVKIPKLGAMTITYSDAEPNFMAKLLGQKEPEGMIAVFVSEPNDVVTELWKDDCKILSVEQFNQIWHGILRSAEAGIWHKKQFEQNITSVKLRSILNSTYVCDNYNSGTGNSLIVDENYFQFDFGDEKAFQIGFEANENGFDARFKYILPAENDAPIEVQQMVRDFDEALYQNHFENIPIFHWQSYIAAKRWFEWGSAYLECEQKEWDIHIEGFSKFVPPEQFDELITLPSVDELFIATGENGWSESVDFTIDGIEYLARFFKANEAYSRSVIRFFANDGDDSINFSLIKIGSIITANSINFEDENQSMVNLMGEHSFEKVIEHFRRIRFYLLQKHA